MNVILDAYHYAREGIRNHWKLLRALRSRNHYYIDDSDSDLQSSPRSDRVCTDQPGSVLPFEEEPGPLVLSQIAPVYLSWAEFEKVNALKTTAKQWEKHDLPEGQGDTRPQPKTDKDNDSTGPALVCRGLVSPMAVLGVGEVSSLKHVSQMMIYKFNMKTVDQDKDEEKFVQYHVLNTWGQLLFTGQEEMSMFDSVDVCGLYRNRTIIFRDNAGVEVLSVERFYHWSLSYGLPISRSLHEMIVYSKGRLMGTICHSGQYVPETTFNIRRDIRGPVLFEVCGLPCGGLRYCCCEDGYRIFSCPRFGERNLVGYVRKDWPDSIAPNYHGYYTDHFGLSVSPNIPIDVKTLFIGAAFLIHFVAYETTEPCLCKRTNRQQRIKCETAV